MRSLCRAVLSVAALTLIFSAARAEVVNDLYEAIVPVTSQERDDRHAAIRKGLEEVLIRVSGRDIVAQLPNLPELDQELTNATRFAQQFRYQALRQAPTAPPLGVVGAPVPTQALWVKFDEKAVNDLLKGQGLPVWGQTRPVTLVWLVEDANGQRDILTSTSQGPVRDALEERAHLRGLPLRLPFYDLSDRAGLNLSDVWGNFGEAIQRASQRYQTEAVLVGRLLKGAGNFWQARWTLYQNGQRQEWEAQGEGLLPVISPAIDQTTEALATRFAMLAPLGEHDKISVRIAGINDLVHYNKVVKYLHSLSVITSVNPSQVSATNAVFDLESQGGRIAVAQAIELGHVLIPDRTSATSTNAGSHNNDLTYRMVP